MFNKFGEALKRAKQGIETLKMVASEMMSPSAVCQTHRPHEELIKAFKTFCEDIDRTADCDTTDNFGDFDMRIDSKSCDKLAAIVELLRQESRDWMRDNRLAIVHPAHHDTFQLLCFEAFVENHMTQELCLRAIRDVPRGCMPVILNVMVLLLRGVRYPLLEHQTIHRPIANLISIAARFDALRDAFLKSGSPAQNSRRIVKSTTPLSRGQDTNASDRATEYSRAIDVGLMGLVGVIWQRIRDNPVVLDFFTVLDTRVSKEPHRPVMQPQMDVLTAAIGLCVRSGSLGLAAREALLIAAGMRDARVDTFILTQTSLSADVVAALSERFYYALEALVSQAKQSAADSTGRAFLDATNKSGQAQSASNSGSAASLTGDLSSSAALVAVIEQVKSPSSSSTSPAYPGSSSPLEEFLSLLRFCDALVARCADYLHTEEDESVSISAGRLKCLRSFRRGAGAYAHGRAGAAGSMSDGAQSSQSTSDRELEIELEPLRQNFLRHYREHFLERCMRGALLASGEKQVVACSVLLRAAVGCLRCESPSGALLADTMRFLCGLETETAIHTEKHLKSASSDTTTSDNNILSVTSAPDGSQSRGLPSAGSKTTTTTNSVNHLHGGSVSCTAHGSSSAGIGMGVDLVLLLLLGRAGSPQKPVSLAGSLLLSTLLRTARLEDSLEIVHRHAHTTQSQSQSHTINSIDEDHSHIGNDRDKYIGKNKDRDRAILTTELEGGGNAEVATPALLAVTSDAGANDSDHDHGNVRKPPTTTTTSSSICQLLATLYDEIEFNLLLVGTPAAAHVTAPSAPVAVVPSSNSNSSNGSGIDGADIAVGVRQVTSNQLSESDSESEADLESESLIAQYSSLAASGMFARLIGRLSVLSSRTRSRIITYRDSDNNSNRRRGSSRSAGCGSSHCKTVHDDVNRRPSQEITGAGAEITGAEIGGATKGTSSLLVDSVLRRLSSLLSMRLDEQIALSGLVEQCVGLLCVTLVTLDAGDAAGSAASSEMGVSASASVSYLVRLKASLEGLWLQVQTHLRGLPDWRAKMEACRSYLSAPDSLNQQHIHPTHPSSAPAGPASSSAARPVPPPPPSLWPKLAEQESPQSRRAIETGVVTQEMLMELYGAVRALRRLRGTLTEALSQAELLRNEEDDTDTETETDADTDIEIDPENEVGIEGNKNATNRTHTVNNGAAFFAAASSSSSSSSVSQAKASGILFDTSTLADCDNDDCDNFHDFSSCSSNSNGEAVAKTGLTQRNLNDGVAQHYYNDSNTDDALSTSEADFLAEYNSLQHRFADLATVINTGANLDLA